MTVMTSREFNQDASRAKREAEHGPVFITDRGRPAHVLLSMAEYQRLAVARGGKTLLDALAFDGPDFDWEPPRLDGEWFRPADFE